MIFVAIGFFIFCQVNTNCLSCSKEHDVEVGQALFAAFFMQRNGNATENYYIFTCLHWHLCSPHQIITNNSALVLKCIPDKIRRQQNGALFILCRLVTLHIRWRGKRSKRNPVSPIVLTSVACTRGQPNDTSKYVISHLGRRKTRCYLRT